MKKVIICALIAALIMSLIACSFRPATRPGDESDSSSDIAASNSESASESASESVSESESEDDPTPPEPTNVLPVGIYLQNGAAEDYDIKETLTGTWYEGMTLACFAILPSNDANVKGSTYTGLWYAAYEANITDKSARLGFIMAVSTGTTTESYMILRPSDTADVKNMNIYLYDDLHQSTGWYSHLTETGFNDNSMITSFKITAGADFANVRSIVLSAFWYTPDQIVNGNYTGSSIATIIITPN